MINSKEAERLQELDLMKPPQTIMEGGRLEFERQKGRRELGALTNLVEQDPPKTEEIYKLASEILVTAVNSQYFEDGMREGLEDLPPTRRLQVIERIDQTRKALLEEYLTH